jgi:N utilization substance protein B
MTNASPRQHSKHARIRSRRSLVQAYYQWLITQQPVAEIIREFKIDRTELQKADIDYFERVLRGMIHSRDDLIRELQPFLDRPDSELDPVENAVLHLGSYELMYMQEIPCRVVINEAIDLARMFGAEQSYKYINGVLDKFAHKHRASELNAKR